MHITVVGTGYVGLVTGTCLAATGHHVVCVDIDEKKIASLKKGIVPIYEPGLDEIMVQNVSRGRLRFSTDLVAEVGPAEIIMIAVGTPMRDDGSADLSYVLEAADTIGENLNGYKVVVDKSTVPVGTGDLVHQRIAKHTKVEFDVVSNPEFLKEGDAISDFMKPDRIVVGVDSERAAVIMRKLYAPFQRTGHRLIEMDVRSAELTKYAANALLATKITFMNEIANLCEKVGADVTSVRYGIGSDTRIGKHFLFPGVGYGGSCFPKDVNALIHTAAQHQSPMKILEAVDAVNSRQRLRVAEKVIEYFGQKLNGKKLALWGLSFKPRTDDMREAPSIYTVNDLLQRGAEICAYDPAAMDEAKKIFGDRIKYLDDCYAPLDGADALLIVTEWKEFHMPEFAEIKKRLKAPVIFDGRNLYEPEEMKELGFTYYSIGRKEIS